MGDILDIIFINVLKMYELILRNVFYNNTK